MTTTQIRRILITVTKPLALLAFALVLSLSTGACGSDEVCSGSSCQCEEGGDCTFSCPEGGCEVDCPQGSTCDISCAGGNCDINCGTDSSCDIDCSGGGCTTQCLSAEVCEQTCEGDECICAGCGPLF
jgi:hypothetical protein